MKKITCMGVGILSVAATLSAQTTVYSDTFEDDTLAATAPVLSGSDIGNSYVVFNGALLIAANPEANGNTSSQVLTMDPTTQVGGNQVMAMFTSSTAVDGLVLEYDFYCAVATTGDPQDSVRVTLIGDADFDREVVIRNDADSLLRIDGTDQTETNFGESTWQHFKASISAIDAAAGSYTVDFEITNLETSATVTGSHMVQIDTTTFTDGKSRGILIELFRGEPVGNDFVAYVDNFHVTYQPSAAASIENFSVRSAVGTGEQALILGFVLGEGADEQLLVRGVGPGLDPLIEEAVLPDPRLGLYSGQTEISFNDNWTGDDGRALGAFELDAGSNDAVLDATLGTGLYTTVVTDVDGATGQAMVELYNKNPGVSINLLNLSARSQLPSNETLIAGLVISGTGSRTFLVRVVGPGLSRMVEEEVHPDPKLEVFAGETSIAVNNDWEVGNDGAALSAAFTATGAFSLNPGSKDAATLVTLGSGNYTIHATTNDGSSGIVLIEIYAIPES